MSRFNYEWVSDDYNAVAIDVTSENQNTFDIATVTIDTANAIMDTIKTI